MKKKKSLVKKMPFVEYLKWLDHQREMLGGATKLLKPPHPGEILKKDYLESKKISQTDLAKTIGCTYAKLNEVVNGKRGVTAKFALDLEKATKIKAETWMRLQVYYDLSLLRA